MDIRIFLKKTNSFQKKLTKYLIKKFKIKKNLFWSF